ncbi:hypothetical protein ACFX2H_008577 [Malus domestica]
MAFSSVLYAVTRRSNLAEHQNAKPAKANVRLPHHLAGGKGDTNYWRGASSIGECTAKIFVQHEPKSSLLMSTMIWAIQSANPSAHRTVCSSTVMAQSLNKKRRTQSNCHIRKASHHVQQCRHS